MGINRDNEHQNGQDKARAAFSEAGLGGDAPRQPEQTQDERVHLASKRLDNNAAAGPQGVNSRFFRSVPRAQASQVVVETKKAFDAALDEFQIKTVEQGIAYRFDTVDQQTTAGVKMGALLSIAHFEAPTDGRKKMVVMVIMLDGSVPTLGVTEVKQPALTGLRPDTDRQPLFRQLTALDYLTDSFRSAIIDKLKRTYGDYDIEIMGNCTLPRKFDLSKEAGQVHEMLVNVIGALETYIGAIYANESPLTIRDVAHNAQTSIKMDLDKTAGRTANGLPLRRDVSLTLHTTQRSANPGEPDDVIEVVKASGYIDLVYTEPNQPLQSNQRVPTQRFTAFYMLTNMTSVGWNLITPETQLLALSMAPIMAYNEQFLAPLMKGTSGSDPDHDAGALGYVVNYGADENGLPLGKEDTSKLSTKEQLDLLRMAIFEHPRVALVIDSSGPLSWMNTMFVEAAKGIREAEDAVIHAADNLTGKVFGQKWDERNSNAPLFYLRGGKHVGYYEKSNVGERPLDDFDTLWALNKYGDSNIDRAWDFMETYLDTADLEVQMAKRWKMITAIVPGATLVSEATVVEPSADFLEVLMDSVITAGLPLRATTYLQDFTGTRGRASFHGGRGLDGASIASSLQRGYGTTERRQSGSFGTLGFNRWGGTRRD